MALRVLTPDCGSCAGLCCMALPFARSADFAFDKAEGEPCRHLTPADSCGIHAGLRERGMPGCTVFECFGAGQRVTEQVLGGRSWRDSPAAAAEAVAALGVVRQLHEMLALLEQVERRTTSAATRTRAAELAARVDALADGTAAEVVAADVDRARAGVGALLREVSAAVRTPPGEGLSGRDLVGADLRGRDLRRADLSGSLLIGADLAGADLREADLLGADLRATVLDGTDLHGALFLTQPQVNAARGDVRTRLPDGLRAPDHWPGG